MRNAEKHLIQCHCILPQYRNRPDPVFHKFTVFSILENDKVEEKVVQCPNCGVLHKVVDICKSEIASGKDESKTIIQIEDIKISLPDRLAEILEAYNSELPTWEHAQFVIDEKRWGDKVRLSFEENEEDSSAKFLLFNGRDQYRIVSDSSQSFIGVQDD
tara:strand:- start:265 stop:741 length:477 start_codon:yes stop_codon:yes gene_type:complete